MTPEPTIHAWVVRGGMVAETRNGAWQTYEQEQRLKENAMTPKEQLEQMFPLVSDDHDCVVAQRRDVLRRVCAYIMARGCLSNPHKYMQEMDDLTTLIWEGLELQAADLEGL